MTKPRVFVLERTKFDLTPLIPKWASDNDHIVYLFQEHVNPRPSTWAREYQEQIFKRLHEEKFDCDIDYVACSGHFVPVTVMIGAIALCFDAFNILHFSPSERTYSCIRLDSSYADKLSDAV